MGHYFLDIQYNEWKCAYTLKRRFKSPSPCLKYPTAVILLSWRINYMEGRWYCLGVPSSFVLQLSVSLTSACSVYPSIIFTSAISPASVLNQYHLHSTLIYSLCLHDYSYVNVVPSYRERNKKSRPIFYCNLLHKMGQDFLDRRYMFHCVFSAINQMIR